jgi:hypothetical protein
MAGVFRVGATSDRGCCARPAGESLAHATLAAQFARLPRQVRFGCAFSPHTIGTSPVCVGALGPAESLGMPCAKGACPFSRFGLHTRVPTNSRGAFIALGIPAERANKRIIKPSLPGNPAHRRSREESPLIAHIHEDEPPTTDGRSAFGVRPASFLPAGIPKAENARRECDRPAILTQLRAGHSEGSRDVLQQRSTDRGSFR